MKPWKLPKSEVEIVKNYNAKVLNIQGSLYDVSFYDPDQDVEVFVSFHETLFEGLPYPASVGSDFMIVIYRTGSNDTSLSMWPIPKSKFWHKSWNHE